MPKYVYGPVPSRRLGRSLGVDLVPAKTCTLDCLYCQLGSCARTTTERRQYVDPEEVVREVESVLESSARPDYVTLSGSGEPTLNTAFGRVARMLKERTDVPVALVTNATLLHLPEVRADCAVLDVILPSLDAGDEETFRRMNRPHPDVTFEKVLEGLEALRREVDVEMWLEVFIIEGVNTGDKQVENIKRAVDRINPDRIQLNTAVRPPAEADVRPATRETMEKIRSILGPRCEIIAEVAPVEEDEQGGGAEEQVMEMLRRRPCTADDVASGLSMPKCEAIKYLERLRRAGRVSGRKDDGGPTYYRVADEG